MSSFARLTLLTSALVVSASASAHISLIEPTPRYTVNEGIKACPCGAGSQANNRTCGVPTERSDPARNESRASTFVAGSTITLRFDEFVAHSGRYRVAFDADGADQDDFDANPLVDIPDPSGNTGNTGEGSIWEIEVTLPSTPCDNCTLQLIQMMDGNTTDPVDSSIGRSTYYQCIDLVLTPAEDTDGGVAGGGDEGDGGGVAFDDDGQGGCSHLRPSQSGAPASLFAVLGLLGALWRRRRLRERMQTASRLR